jgi:CRISPR-associated protein Cmr4
MVTMSIETTMLYLYVETPLHAGVGSGLSNIDLPIQRERPTQYPMIQGSGIKGKLRATAEDMAERKQTPFDNGLVAIMFGPENGSDHAGALIAGDARMLLFPVRSLNGVFAYTTSYDVLNRFMRDMNRGNGSLKWQLPHEGLSEHITHITKERKSRVAVNDRLVLEEFSFDAKPEPRVDKIAEWLADNALPQSDEYVYWREKVKDSLVILPEEDFRDFVMNATEIITRISIDREKKTATGKALWTEEHLPTDTLLYVPIYATNARKTKKEGDKIVPEMLAADILDNATKLENSQQGYLQLGGDETVGRGMVRMHWGDNAKKENSNDTTAK